MNSAFRVLESPSFIIMFFPSSLIKPPYMKYLTNIRVRDIMDNPAVSTAVVVSDCLVSSHFVVYVVVVFVSRLSLL